MAIAAAHAASGQVLEVGEDGAVTVYDRPAVYDGAAATPIGPAPPLPLGKRRNAGRTAPGSTDGLVDAAVAAELSPDLIEAVAWSESRLRAGVVSRAGAVGEMQLMPGTARALGVDPTVSAENYRGGAAYLRQLLARYDGDLPRALAAYNAGPGAVDKRGAAPWRETRAYVAAVLDRLGQRATGTLGSR